MNRIALIDGGELLFRVAAGSEVRRWNVYIQGEEKDGYLSSHHYKDDAEMWVRELDLQEDLILTLDKYPVSERLAKENLDIFIKTIITKTEASSVLICFGHPTGANFRNDIATYKKYKDRPKDRPHHYYMLKDYVQRNYPWYETSLPYEDDDILAIIHNEIWKQERNLPIICSHDKDMLQVPGWHYHTDHQELFPVSEVEGLYNFYKQLLSGDPVDTIPGLYQITGVKNSKKYLERLDYLASKYGERDLKEIETAMYMHVFNTYLTALNGKVKCREQHTDLDCILWEIGNLLYLRRTWDDQGWEIPV